VTGKRHFAFGRRPGGLVVDGIASITVEDVNQNGTVDPGEPQLDP